MQMCSLATLQNIMDKTTLERKILENSVQMLLQEHLREKSVFCPEDDGESFLCTDEATDAIRDVVHQFYVMCSQIKQLLEVGADRTRKTLNSQETQKQVEEVRKQIESAVHSTNANDTEKGMLQIFDPEAERSATKDRITYHYLHSRQQRALLR